MTGAGFHPARGELVDIGGRRLRAVRAGPAGDRPLIVLECGAFGCAADWAVVQDRLSAKGMASLAYDRAGLGYSDPGPAPRDGAAIADDLGQLLARLGEHGPYVMVGHSMAGLLLRVFVPRHRDRVLGVVLVDAAMPEAMEVKSTAGAVNAYRGAMRLVGMWSAAGFMRPVSLVIGDLIGLEGEASAEKRRVYGSAGHTKWAAEEVQQWPRTSLMGRAPFDPDLPVAVVTAGDERFAAPLKRLQVAPALASTRGYVDHVRGANHASLLGKRFADPIVKGVEHMLCA
ncbi:alpha/beta hydrolase [Phenylobacterium sp. LH3H17]|uniref:alpha/beta fold hydrolase n=1 Tax=Phenylobacterium sp. LH3H17 TaxID=2903901 RepID=UPI0020C9BA08|nr:alpha/beta hydrolase [Phenylobacterium sp. LH3H17]UTP40170.1 alpha/beta hydrolase [Phenylobacterium sp. LH3H17]